MFRKIEEEDPYLQKEAFYLKRQLVLIFFHCLYLQVLMLRNKKHFQKNFGARLERISQMMSLRRKLQKKKRVLKKEIEEKFIGMTSPLESNNRKNTLFPLFTRKKDLSDLYFTAYEIPPRKKNASFKSILL